VGERAQFPGMSSAATAPSESLNARDGSRHPCSWAASHPPLRPPHEPDAANQSPGQLILLVGSLLTSCGGSQLHRRSSRTPVAARTGRVARGAGRVRTPTSRESGGPGRGGNAIGSRGEEPCGCHVLIPIACLPTNPAGVPARPAGLEPDPDLQIGDHRRFGTSPVTRALRRGRASRSPQRRALAQPWRLAAGMDPAQPHRRRPPALLVVPPATALLEGFRDQTRPGW